MYNHQSPDIAIVDDYDLNNVTVYCYIKLHLYINYITSYDTMHGI